MLNEQGRGIGGKEKWTPLDNMMKKPWEEAASKEIILFWVSLDNEIINHYFLLYKVKQY